MNPPGRCRVNIFGYIPPPCAAPPARRYPTGFAGVFHATVSGLVVGWLAMVEVVDAGVVECVGHTSVRCRGCSCWPRVGSSWWPSSLLVVWASLVFEVVGVPAGRGLGGHVSCPRPLPWRHPSGFAGVSFATVSGLVVGLSTCCLLVDDFVVDSVGHTGVRGCGRGCWPRTVSW